MTQFTTTVCQHVENTTSLKGERPTKKYVVYPIAPHVYTERGASKMEKSLPPVPVYLCPLRKSITILLLSCTGARPDPPAHTCIFPMLTQSAIDPLLRRDALGIPPPLFVSNPARGAPPEPPPVSEDCCVASISRIRMA